MLSPGQHNSVYWPFYHGWMQSVETRDSGRSGETYPNLFEEDNGGIEGGLSSWDIGCGDSVAIVDNRGIGKKDNGGQPEP